MGFKNFLKKSVARISAAAMALTMLAMPASPVFAEGPNDNLFLSKGIELQSDGNYKIKLEAYATGTDTTTTTTESVPLDIVLVLDQSGSMAESFASEYTYTARNSQGYSYSDLKNKEYYYKDGGEYYRVQRGSNDGYYLYYEKNGQPIYLSGTGTTTTQPTNITSRSTIIWTGVLYTRQATSTTTKLQALKSAVTNFVDTVKTDATTNSVNHRISIVGFASTDGYGYNTEILSIAGSNSGSVGVRYATNLANSSYRDSLQDVSTTAGQNMLTSAINALAAEGATRTDKGMEMASKVLANATNTGVYNQANRKKLVIMFTDGTPTTESDFSSTVANNAINYSKTIKASNTSVYSIGIFEGANPSLLNSNENKFMNYVSSNYPNASSMTNVGTGSNAGYYKAAANASELSSIFELISNTETNSGTTVTLNANSVLRDVLTDEFDLASSTISAYTVNGTANSAGVITWGTKAGDIAASNITVNGKTIDVKGFDYSNEFITANHPGKKLVVEILVNGAVDVSGMDLYSNTEASGIYSAEGTFVKPFVNPTVDIPEYSYVLDYGKKVDLPNVDEAQGKNYQETTKMNTTKAAPSQVTEITKDYGVFSLANNTVSYKPGKINWNGFDSVFSFAKKADNTYEWSKTNVIPATSVYYEDDFGTDSNKDSNVAIVWTGSWTKDGYSQVEKQSATNENYGWDESYKDDAGYSNGSAHMTSAKAATATFTFTGTGVDIYSKTNPYVGKVRVSLYKGDKATPMKTYYMDNKSASGEYYQIPTLTFENLEYATYTVKIVVMNNSTVQGQATYYLDGIRVYNPLGAVSEESTAGKAYKKADEYNAAYIKLRDNLLENGFGADLENEVGGVVFIDKVEGEIGTTTTEAFTTYKDYGPKNEVYLASGQSIAFNLGNFNSSTNKLAIGIKALNGSTSVEFTNGAMKTSETIGSASDLYYTVTPNANNNVVIKNTGNNILSVTKIKITEKANTGRSYSLKTTPELISYANSFASLPVAIGNGLEVEEPKAEVEEPNVENVEDSTLKEEDVEIEQPNTKEETPAQSKWEKLLSGIGKWFKR